MTHTLTPREAFGTIGAVVVTYNRLDDLKIVLSAYDSMEYYPDFVLVIDNASDSDTKSFLERWSAIESAYRRIVIRMSENTGGAGGFKTGIDRALEEGADWVFVADDDAVPRADVFERLAEGHDLIDEPDKLSALCTAVHTSEGIDLSHRRRVKTGLLSVRETAVPLAEYAQDYFYLDEFSYVGAFIRANAVRAVGSTRGDFFIFYDDTEHSLRLRNYGPIACVPAAVTEHKTSAPASLPDVTWKSYYGWRNSLITTKERFSRWHFFWKVVNEYLRQCSSLAQLLRHRSPERVYVMRRAIGDALHGKTGLSADFPPGKPVEIKGKGCLSNDHDGVTGGSRSDD